MNDNGKLAMMLFRYMERQYPIQSLSKRTLRMQSARRWIITELANRILDHPRESPVSIAENLVGQVASMIYRKTDNNIPQEKIKSLGEALGALLNAEYYINEVCK